MNDAVVDIAFAAGDGRRATILRALRHDSFAVSELSQLLDLAQTALSHHLRILREAGLVVSRREGNSLYYRREDATSNPFMSALFDALDETPVPAGLEQAIEHVHAEREQQVERFFRLNADALKSQRMLISETRTYAPSLETLWQQVSGRKARALEVGPGDGEILGALARDFGAVTAIDQVARMLEPVRQDFARNRHITFVEQEYTRFRSREPFDAIIAAMVLHHFPSPRVFFAQSAKLLAVNGCLFIAELERHEHQWVREACGDLWLGFDATELDRWANHFGLIAGPRQFLAQKNGFSIQILTYSKEPA
jgi:ArsR family transcriptional regulator